jgi:sorbitol-6-phosphate 2-dehydrogenase
MKEQGAEEQGGRGDNFSPAWSDRSMIKSLQDRIALVTGGAQGLGQAICQRLAAEGCQVVVADLNGEAAESTAAEIATTTDRQTLAMKVDVTDDTQVESLVAQALEKFGRLDIVVANAGIVIGEDITEFPADKWRLVMDVNLFGYFLTAKHAARAMKAQKSGVIIQINSKSGKKGSYKNSAYAASKFGGIGLTQSIALDLAEYGVRVNAVCPGNLLDSPLWIDSLYSQYAKKWGISEAEVRQRYIDQVPMKRGCTYEDVCNVVAFLASDQASYMTGQAINVTGGQEMR